MKLTKVDLVVQQFPVATIWILLVIINILLFNHHLNKHTTNSLGSFYWKVHILKILC